MTAPRLFRAHLAGALALFVALTACSGTKPTAAPSSASQSPSPTASGPQELPIFHGGSDYPITPGTYVLGARGDVPGLQLFIPAGWSGNENDEGEFSLIPRGHAKDSLFVWVDLVAVNSSGKNHGQVAAGVGKSPQDLLKWLTTNPDFKIVSKPAAATVGNVNGTALTFAVSSTARAPDKGCPAYPHCVEIFTNEVFWGSGNTYGISAPSEERLFLATIHFKGTAHTVLVNLDSQSHSDLLGLMRVSKPVLASFRFPT